MIIQVKIKNDLKVRIYVILVRNDIKITPYNRHLQFRFENCRIFNSASQLLRFRIMRRENEFKIVNLGFIIT